MREKTFINCCPTGMIPTKNMNHHVPVGVTEIINESVALARQGVGILHLHARDESGEPTWDPEIYRRIIAGIREQTPEVIICTSTSGRLWSDFERRSAVLELSGDDKPDMASMTLGSLNFMHSASCNEPKIIRDLCQKMLDNGIKPELEIFDTGMLNQMQVLIKAEVLRPPYYVNFLFGNIYSMQCDLTQVDYALRHTPKECTIGFAGVGKYQLLANSLALTLGYGARVGLEDNLFLDDDKKVMATNNALVARVVGLAKILERELMTAAELRQILGL